MKQQGIIATKGSFGHNTVGQHYDINKHDLVYAGRILQILMRSEFKIFECRSFHSIIFERKKRGFWKIIFQTMLGLVSCQKPFEETTWKRFAGWNEIFFFFWISSKVFYTKFSDLTAYGRRAA